ncbi:TolB family protein [Kallotenue papyrolyticum]|uniref:TolB family protein n=1 Tax=Kallotenue papyrolyticum TaxID=1325125 RepID=UPI00047855B5|nr:TolB family protein [Kallotenue papyrolyticum]
MLSRHPFHRLTRALTIAALGALVAGVFPTHAAPWAGNRSQFASPRFEQVWNAADKAVVQGQTNRSWTWGPTPWFDYKEFYKQSPHGLRQVQYFDKARMEINDPAATDGALGGVTNGLLPVEMISGRVKLGDGIGPDEYNQFAPANIPVAGDPAAQNPDAPTYASFRNVATTDNAYRDQNKVGQRVGQTFDKNGTIGYREVLANQQGTDIVAYETVTGHNVPRVFNDFRNAGPVPAIFAFGYPITDPYWIRARVGGQEKDIMVQIYERRVLTYTPSNPPAFRVEMGNVGQHYFQWRYPDLGHPWATPDPHLPIVYASQRDANPFAVYMMNPNGSNQIALTGDGYEVIPFSIKRAWAPINLRIFGDFLHPTKGKRQLVSMPLWYGGLTGILDSDANDYQPAISPDGTKIAFVSDRDGNPELYLLNIGRDGITPGSNTPTRLTDTIGCANEHPSWLPDGSGLVYNSNCQDGNFEVYRADLSYTQDKFNELAVARLISPTPSESTRLTHNNTDDRFPRVSPNGASIAFFSTRDGNSEIYTMTIDGGQQTRLTFSASRDEAPTWSPDGSRIVFNSDRDGDHEIYSMSLDGREETQVTNNAGDDGYAVWAQ